MFTGIVEATAKVLEQTTQELLIERPPSFDDLRTGSSVSVSGVCLTVTRLTGVEMTFDVVPETWSKTTLRGLEAGDRVNLERAMRAADRFEGHVVQGHVEGVGLVTSYELRVTGAEITIQPSDELTRNLVAKGSIAIDGVSLTIASMDGNRCTIALIPHTVEHTTLGALREGDHVNIETDVMVRALLSSHAH